jgi:hypothetical protein
MDDPSGYGFETGRALPTLLLIRRARHWSTHRVRGECASVEG